MLTLDDIFDQPAAIASIRRAYASGRLPHGLVFAGPAGVGKATTARALAGLFLCERPAGDAPCGACAGCRAMAAEPPAHPDYHVVTRDLIRYHDKTGKSKGVELSINVIRPELVEPAGRKAVMGRGKVFVVEQAELMNPAAQNALLKTLEEPAGRTLIVLLTDQIDLLLSTIRSRSQVVRFGSLPEATVVRELHARGVDPAVAARAARFTRGSLGVALRWVEDDVVDPAGELAAQVDALFAGTPPDDLPGWFKRAAEAYAGKQMERDPLGSKDAATREGLALYLNVAAEHVRRLLPGLTDAAALERACAAIDALARAESYLDGNVNASLVFQQLAVTLEREAVA
ncbi:MAG: DNA polymerase III delta prime subunit [uncultured Phycisphaerae bacterium]|uniref:DNA polymerase III delta prime subunit n=1 Tax=uncultured Phycisphaerae bacterium TaxID=904963 RepID=A0A6J4PTJ3_9BACT|nr:MAG: DNA polymerase III delta prime subunit [uncultured Phycisphaerae bacterium]